MAPIFREKIGPFSRLSLMNCEDDFFHVHDFYSKYSISRRMSFFNCLDADFILFVNMVEDDPSLGASSISCLYSSISPKSLAGTFIYNSVHAEPLEITIDETISTIIHEIFHSVFFDFILFERFPKTSKGQEAFFIDSNGIYQLRCDTFLELVKQHFNCIEI